MTSIDNPFYTMKDTYTHLLERTIAVILNGKAGIDTLLTAVGVAMDKADCTAGAEDIAKRLHNHYRLLLDYI